MQRLCNMYDKVKFQISKYDIGENNLPYILQSLDIYAKNLNCKTGEIKEKCRVGCLSVFLNHDTITIVGSLPKYMYGSNLYPLDRKQTKKAIEKIAQIFYVTPDKIKVISLEFGANFVMKYGVEMYLEKLGSYPRLQRKAEYKDSIYYQGRGQRRPKVFALYDKKSELQRSGIAIPKGLQDSHILRAEIRYNDRLSQQLNVPMVTGATLSDNHFYRMMVQRFQSEYMKIKKVNTPNQSMEDIKTPMDAYDYLFTQLLEKTGNKQQVINDFISLLRANNAFKNRIYYTQLRKRIEKAICKNNVAMKDDLIRELDDCFLNIGAYV